jgi:hypothetical protein
MAQKTRQSVETEIVARALKDPSFKQQLLTNPSVARAEIEKNSPQKLPADYKVQVLEENEKTLYIVLPYIPTGSNLSEADLDAVASGVNVSIPCMIQSATFP